MITCPKYSRFFTLLVLSVFCTGALAQQRMTAEEYIRLYQEAAIQDMQKTGVPASITLAQGMYESDYGNSPLAKNAKNHFGIKCHKEWNGPTYHQDDDAADECFRKYDAVQQSYDDHSYFLRSRERYSSLFTLEITDYKGWAHGLKKAGYATNPHYASKLVELIERYKLNELDKGGPAVPAPVFASTSKDVPAETKVKKADAPAEEKAKSEASIHVAPAPSQLNLPILTSGNTINEVPFVRAAKGDSWLKIANENNLELYQILEFNEVDKNKVLRENEIVYLKPKKTRCEQVYHVVQKGESIHSISQLYGVKVAKLCQRNQLYGGKEPAPGTKLYLKMHKSFHE